MSSISKMRLKLGRQTSIMTDMHENLKRNHKIISKVVCSQNKRVNATWKVSV